MLILSLNVRGGVNKNNKPYKIIDFLNQYPFDIALLQETSVVKQKNVTLFEQELNVNLYQDDNLNRKQCIGVVALIKKTANIKVIKIQYPNIIGQGRLQEINLEAFGQNVKLYNLYASTHVPSKISQWAKLKKYLSSKCNIILMGDFNSTLNEEEKMGNIEKKHTDDHLKSLINGLKLIDIASMINDCRHTYIGRITTSLIDRIVISKDLKQFFLDYENIVCPTSDHNAIFINLFSRRDICPKKTRRERKWKLNTSLINDAKIKEKIANFWHEYRYAMDICSTTMDWYLQGKEKMKNILIKEGKIKARIYKINEEKLREGIRQEMKAAKPNLELINKHKKELDKIIDYRVEGIKVRNREITLPHEERGSRAFYNIDMRAKKQETKMEELIDASGQKVKAHLQVNDLIHDFYNNLYSSQEINNAAITCMIEQYKPVKDNKK